MSVYTQVKSNNWPSASNVAEDYLVLALPLDSNPIIDYAAKAGSRNLRQAKVVAPTGASPDNTFISSTYSKFYGSSLYIGSGAALEPVFSTDFVPFKKDWCIEFWMYSPALPSNSGLWSIGYYNTTGSHDLMTGGSGALRYDADGSTTRFANNEQVLPTGAWAHHATVRNGGTIKHYINATEIASFACGTNFELGYPSTASGAAKFYIGNRYGLGTGSYNIASYFQDFRMYVGHAKYTSGGFALPGPILSTRT